MSLSTKHPADRLSADLHAQITELPAGTLAALSGRAPADVSVVVGMSGGVDSSLAAAILQAQGFKVLVDGNRCPDVENCEAIIKGDLIEPIISAASIIAKVTRDRQMKVLDQIYPEYGFSRHKGYGTKEHLEALAKHGPIGGQHRFTFAPIKKLVSA